MHVIQPKEAKRQHQAPRHTTQAVKPPAGKSAGAMLGGGLNGAGPGGRAGGASTSLVFSLSWPDEEDEASFLVLGSADPVSIPMAMAVGIPAEED